MLLPQLTVRSFNWSPAEVAKEKNPFECAFAQFQLQSRVATQITNHVVQPRLLLSIENIVALCNWRLIAINLKSRETNNLSIRYYWGWGFPLSTTTTTTTSATTSRINQPVDDTSENRSKVDLAHLLYTQQKLWAKIFTTPMSRTAAATLFLNCWAFTWLDRLADWLLFYLGLGTWEFGDHSPWTFG